MGKASKVARYVKCKVTDSCFSFQFISVSFLVRYAAVIGSSLFSGEGNSVLVIEKS